MVLHGQGQGETRALLVQGDEGPLDGAGDPSEI